MVKITFPDNNVREFPKGINGIDIAKSLSNSLAKEIVAIEVNGETWDATRPINENATIKLFKFQDEEGKHAFWHSSAHIMAEAIEFFYPGVKLAIG
ncbi:MAG: threonine--tRNA ligase, partial [Bacteroidetes bacterium]